MPKRIPPAPPRKRSAKSSNVPAAPAPLVPESIPVAPPRESVSLALGLAAPNSLGLDANGYLKEGVLRRFVFQTFGRSRRTQDSPVMPDVFLRYIRLAEKQATRGSPGGELIDLLLTPWTGVRPGQIASELNNHNIGVTCCES